MAYIPQVSGNVGIGDGPSRDAFGRLRVSQPNALLSALFLYNTEPLKVEYSISGTGVAGAHAANERWVALSCTAGSGSSGMQSYRYAPYSVNKSQFIASAFRFGAAVTGVTRRIGYYDSLNGIFFQQDGDGTLRWTIRSTVSGSTVDTNTVASDAWNLDRLNGADASKLTLDITKVQQLIIDFQFHGMGRVRVGFNIGGEIVYVHEFSSTNVGTVPYMQRGALPFRAEIITSGAAGTNYLYVKSATVLTEGAAGTELAYEFATPEATVTAASGTRTHLLSIRPRTTFNSLTNRMEIDLTNLSLLVTGAQPVLWELVIGATFSAGPTWANVDATYSGTEYTSAVGTLSTAGIVVASGYVSGAAGSKVAIDRELNINYPITLDASGAARANGTLSLLVTGIGGSSACRATMEILEIR